MFFQEIEQAGQQRATKLDQRIGNLSSAKETGTGARNPTPSSHRETQRCMLCMQIYFVGKQVRICTTLRELRSHHRHTHQTSKCLFLAQLALQCAETAENLIEDNSRSSKNCVESNGKSNKNWVPHQNKLELILMLARPSAP